MNVEYSALFLIFGLLGLGTLLLSWRRLVTEEEELAERARITWKLLVPMYSFFASIAVGLAIIAGASELGYARGDPRILAWEAFASLIPAWVLVYLDLGGPHKALNIITGFNKTSRIAWNVVFYTLMTLSLFWLIISPSQLSAIAAIVFSVLLETNLGMAYATSSIPGWTPLKTAEFVVAAILLGGSLTLKWELVTVSSLVLLLLDFWETYHVYFESKKYTKVIPKGSIALYYLLLASAAIIAPFNAIFASILAFLGVLIQKVVSACWPQKARLLEEYYKVFWGTKAKFASKSEGIAAFSAFLIWVSAISFGLMLLG